MIKKIFLISLILCITILSGCIAAADIRPQHNNEFVWVCTELSDTYFYWDEETLFFEGLLSYDNKHQEFIWVDDSGLAVDICYPYVVDKDGIYPDKDTFIFGFADYQKDLLTLKIEEDKLNIFNGEITTLTFKPQKWDEFFKE